MSSDVAILILVIFILLLLGMTLLYFVTIPSPKGNTSTVDPNSEANLQEDSGLHQNLNCPVNECAVDIKTGLKRCPEPNAHISYNPQKEVCSIPNGCSNSLLPYAVQPDGGVSFDGRCPNNSICPCVKFPQCPEYIVSAFSAKNGNPYSNNSGQRLNFPQFSFYTNPSDNQYTNSLPITYSDLSSTFCAVPINWITLATPGCPATVGAPTLNDIVVCMNLPRLQGGNACLNGALAFLPQSTSNFSSSQALNTPLGCVRGNSVQCDIGEANVWDNQLGAMICRRL